MSTSSTQNQQQQNQSAQSQPWSPTLGVLGNLIGSLSGQNTSVTPGQTSAVNNLQSAANGIPNFGPSVGGVAGGLLSGIPNLNQNAQTNFQNLSSTLSPYFASGYTDPTKNPATASALNAISQQVGNQVNGQFAAAGRNGSPANTTALAYGISNAEAPYLLNESNQLAGLQQGAAGTLFNAGNTTNNSILSNALSGIGAAGTVPGLSTAGPLAALQAANTGYGLPFSNLGALEGLTLPIAGLGQQTQGQGQSSSNTQYNPSLLGTVGGLLSGGQNSAASGGLSGLMALLNFLP